MSEKYKFVDPEGKYFVTLTIVHWIDLFTRPEMREITIDGIKHCQKEKGLVVHAWVLMHSHAHMIVSSKGSPLENIFRDLKSHTAKKFIKVQELINESRKEWLLRAFRKAGEKLRRISKYKVWQDGNHPILLDTNKLIDEKLDYIHYNPVEAALVDEPEFYLHSSARDYVGSRKGEIEIEFL